MEAVASKYQPGKKSAVPEYYRTFEAQLVALCAPTLAGLKSGSIFSVRATDPEYIADRIARWDERLSPLGLRLHLLKSGYDNGVAIVYVYRPKQVAAQLNTKEARDFLAGCGYQDADLDACIETLRQRLESCAGFPHEIGLFIGYPLDDVKQFIANNGKNCVCCGLWKAYSNKEAKEKYFRKCQKCTEVYSSVFAKGTPIERLALSCQAFSSIDDPVSICI